MSEDREGVKRCLGAVPLALLLTLVAMVRHPRETWKSIKGE